MKPLWIVYNNKLLVGDMLGIIFKNGDGERNLTSNTFKSHLLKVLSLMVSLCFYVLLRSKTRHVNPPDIEAYG